MIEFTVDEEGTQHWYQNGELHKTEVLLSSTQMAPSVGSCMARHTEPTVRL